MAGATPPEVTEDARHPRGPRPMPPQLLAALERARANPMPPLPEEERARLLALANEAAAGGWMTGEDFYAKLAALRPAAAE